MAVGLVSLSHFLQANSRSRCLRLGGAGTPIGWQRAAKGTITQTGDETLVEVDKILIAIFVVRFNSPQT